MSEIYLGVVVFGAVMLAAAAMGWSQWLDHRRRMKALDVIKAALERGAEPPALVYAELTRGRAAKPPWSEVIVFTALAVSFWVAYWRIGGDDAVRFMVVATAFTVTAIGCLVVALMGARGTRPTDDPS
ncbi:MAG: hypothetical protein GC206_02690 [Alphaproteobacteria bacterium]|nr:hypothetical protein [Alphaproteobacteria bacterium]